MPTYETFKYCGHPGCKNVATCECNCNAIHPDEDPVVPEKSQYVHPKFLCDKHVELYEEE